jgi:virginiamycin B lyase
MISFFGSLRPLIHSPAVRKFKARAGKARRLRATRRQAVVVEQMEGRTLLSNITEFSTPTASSGPAGITTGPDGNLWFTEENADKIGMINPTTHAISEFAIPTPNLTAQGGPDSITTGPDGNLWYTQGTQIGMINPTTHGIAEFPLPSGSSAEAITAGPDGNLWFTTELNEHLGFPVGQIGMINPTTHAIAEFTFPNPGNLDFGSSITTGPDGNLWFVQGTEIGMINPTTHAIAEFPTPSGLVGRSITTGPDGNLWFTGLVFTGDPRTTGQFGSIAMINPTTHATTEFPQLQPAPIGITTGPDGNLWFTEGGSIEMINPTTHAITGFPTPSGSYAGTITAGPDGNLWFTGSGSDGGLIGQFQFGPPQVIGSVGVSQSRKETSYTLTFDRPVNSASASNVDLYTVFEGVTKVVKKQKETVYTKALKIKSVVYNAGPDTVTILLAKRHKGPAQVSIAPGLEGPLGTTSSTITLVVP